MVQLTHHQGARAGSLCWGTAGDLIRTSNRTVGCSSVCGDRVWGWGAREEESLLEICLYLYVSHFFMETETPYSIPFCDLPFPHSVCSKHLLLPTVCFSAVLLGMVLWREVYRSVMWMNYALLN